ncbi:MAG TPA: hypothetical protein VJJ23_00015 [Candidatus Nanoarchaeia archaeon]|nr:hypothetical protein [Candidatus Nanoarchaeia archaeon]
MNIRKSLEEYLVTTKEERQVLAVARGKKRQEDYDPYADLDRADIDFFDKFFIRPEEREIMPLSYFCKRLEEMQVENRQVYHSRLLKNWFLYVLSIGLEGMFVPLMIGGVRITFEELRKNRKSPYKILNKIKN